MLLYAYPGNESFAAALGAGAAAVQGGIDWHRFPDGETRVRVDTPPAGQDVWLVCTLAEPDSKIPPLLFAAGTLRELGARRVGLVAPYLAYMRQDTRFHPGEAVSARLFGAWLSGHFDCLVTVDPHLHRLRSLREVFSGASRVVQAAPALAAWIRQRVEKPLLVGPDGESAQWVAQVAQQVGAPWTNLTKERFGDRDVKVTPPDVGAWRDRQPVLVDDIISSGETVIAAAASLRASGLQAPYCVAVHGLYTPESRRRLARAGIETLAVTNTIPQADAAIDIAPLVAAGMAEIAAAAEAG